MALCLLTSCARLQACALCSADDLDGAAPRQLLAALLRNEGSSMLRGLALARSLGPCLTFPSLRPALLEAAASCEGGAFASRSNTLLCINFLSQQLQQRPRKSANACSAKFG